MKYQTLFRENLLTIKLCRNINIKLYTKIILGSISF